MSSSLNDSNSMMGGAGAAGAAGGAANSNSDQQAPSSGAIPGTTGAGAASFLASGLASSSAGSCSTKNGCRPVVAKNRMHPQLLNEKFRIQSYDGGAFKSKSQYNIKHVLTPSEDTFHCSTSGTKFTAIFRCAQDVTLSHLVVCANLKKCTEPLKSGTTVLFVFQK